MAGSFPAPDRVAADSLNELPPDCLQIVILAEQDRNYTWTGGKPMSSLDFDVTAQMSHLEMEWRQAYESSIVARADYQTLAASPRVSANILDMARERLDRTEALKARIMAKIERLEDNLLGQG
jgi:hypothetical protein